MMDRKYKIDNFEQISAIRPSNDGISLSYIQFKFQIFKPRKIKFYLTKKNKRLF